MSEVQIRTRENGPLVVTGPMMLVDQDCNPFDLGDKENVALCRCGASENRPFCDGSHNRCGFKANEKAPAG